MFFLRKKAVYFFACALLLASSIAGAEAGNRGKFPGRRQGGGTWFINPVQVK